MAGAFTTLFLADISVRRGSSLPTGAFLLIMLIFSALVSMGVAVLLERSPTVALRGAPRLVPLITAIGASLFCSTRSVGLWRTGGAYPYIQRLRAMETFSVSKSIERGWLILAAVVIWSSLYVFISPHQNRPRDASGGRGSRDRLPDGHRR